MDPYGSIKKNYHLNKEYEIYLETEKKKLSWNKLWNKEPMERVADKLRKAEELNKKDLRVWVTYNFLALPKNDQEKVKQINER